MAAEAGEPLIMNKAIFNSLKSYGWSQVPRNRCVMLIFDVVSVKDVQPAAESEAKNMLMHVLVFTVKVVNGKRCQPIGNVFFKEDIPAWKISKCIKAYIYDLEKCELFVVATVCPPTDCLRSAIENLIEMGTLQNKTDAHVYSVGHINNIVHVYDAPSMLREVRSRFVKSPVTFQQFGIQYVGNYEDVERILEKSGNEYLRTTVKGEDVNEYAIKLFSMSMSRELQAASNNNKRNSSSGKTVGTSNLCSFFNVLFDSFNGSAVYDNLNRRSLSYSSLHNKIWKDAIPVLESMIFLDCAKQGCSLNEENSCATTNRTRAEHIDGSKLNENISLCVKQKKQKKSKSTNRESEAHHDDDDKISALAKQNDQKKTHQAQNSGCSNLNKDRHTQVKYTVDIKMKAKTIDQAENSSDIKQNIHERIEAATNQHTRRRNSDEHSFASSMLEALNNTQYLDLVLKNIDDESLKCKESRNEMILNQSFVSQAGNIACDKYEDYRRNLKGVLEQSQGADTICDLDSSNEVSCQLLSDAVSIYRAITNLQSHVKKNLYDPKNLQVSSSFEESVNYGMEIGKTDDKRESLNKANSNAILTNDVVKEHTGELVNGNFHKTISNREREMDCEVITALEIDNNDEKVPCPIPQENNLPKIIFQIVEQLQQNEIWDCSCAIDENDAKTAEASTNARMNLGEINNAEQYMMDFAEGSDVEIADEVPQGDDDFKRTRQTRPFVLDAWIISINGMKEIYKNLQQKLFNSMDTKDFSADCVKYMLHMVKQANGIDRPCPVENLTYHVVDKNLVEYAFRSEASRTLK